MHSSHSRSVLARLALQGESRPPGSWLEGVFDQTGPVSSCSGRSCSTDICACLGFAALPDVAGAPLARLVGLSDSCWRWWLLDARWAPLLLMSRKVLPFLLRYWTTRKPLLSKSAVP